MTWETGYFLALIILHIYVYRKYVYDRISMDIYSDNRCIMITMVFKMMPKLGNSFWVNIKSKSVSVKHVLKIKLRGWLQRN